MKARLSVHDQDRHRRQETREVLTEAIDIARETRADGVIVILTHNNTPTAIKMGGRLIKGDAALMQLYRLAMSLAIDHGTNSG